MPIVGIYTKDFPIFPGTLSDSTIIVVAETGNQVTYRSTIGALRNLFMRTFSVTLDSNGEYDFSLNSIREFPTVTIYDSSGNTAPYFYNNTTKKITNGNPNESITVTFI